MTAGTKDKKKLKQDLLEQELCDAVASGRADRAHHDLQSGAHPDCRDGEPLCIAAANGHIDCIKTLLDFRANVAIQNSLPLQLAVKNSKVTAALLLLQHGARVTEAGGMTLITLAERQHQKTLARELLKALEREERQAHEARLRAEAKAKARDTAWMLPGLVAIAGRIGDENRKRNPELFRPKPGQKPG